MNFAGTAFAFNAPFTTQAASTGPFVLTEWVRRSKIVIEKNPLHRGYELDTRYADPNDPRDRKVMEDLRGKRLPQLAVGLRCPGRRHLPAKKLQNICQGACRHSRTPCAARILS